MERFKLCERAHEHVFTCLTCQEVADAYPFIVDKALCQALTFILTCRACQRFEIIEFGNVVATNKV